MHRKRSIRHVSFAILFLLHCWVLPRSLSAAETSPVASEQEEPGIFVEQNTDCMSVPQIQSALSSVLQGREECKNMTVAVVISSAVNHTLVVLRVMDRTTGEILQERSLQLAPAECGQAHLVLKVMLEQFLIGFPIENWSQHRSPFSPDMPPGPCAEAVRIENEMSPLKWMFLVGIDSQWPTPNSDIELTLGFDIGGKRRGVLAQMSFRTDWPRALGEGKYFRTTALLGLGWRVSLVEKVNMRSEIRSGAILISGIGYEENYQQWLIALEGQLALLYRLGAVHLGPEIAVSPIRHSVHTELGDHEELPWIRIGLLMGFPLGNTLMK